LSILHTPALPINRKLALVLASPLLVVFIGSLTSRLLTPLLGDWTWLAVFPVYWGMLALNIAFLGQKGQLRRWWAKPKGSWLWIAISVAIGLVAFPLLLIPNASLLASALPLTAAWFFFGIINAALEEAYWRGFFLDATASLPRVFTVLYSTLLFTANHPLVLGIFSKIQSFDPANPLRFLTFGIILFALSLAYAIIYLKTRSLRLIVLSHFLTDLGNMSVFVFMNMIAMG
jgi:membrane protease YdiL (CAAX protease family)